jgi:broad specificity phosphatase PhoE
MKNLPYIRSMLNIFLLRHGQTAWNADNNRYCGRTDLPLNEMGISQAEAAREQLKTVSFEAVYSSPLLRAYTTAQIISGGEVIKDERLIELSFGAWETKTKEEFIAANGQLWADWMNDPSTARAGGTGETGQEAVTRMDSFFTELLQKHPSGNILVVAHNAANRLYLCHKLGMPLKNYRRLWMQNGEVSMFELEQDGEVVLRNLNVRW